MRLCVLAASVVIAAGCNRSDPPSPGVVSGQARVDPGAVQRTPSPATPAPAAPATASAPAAPSGAAPVAAAAAPTPGTVDKAATGGALPVIHGDKWHDEEEEGGRNFAAFKETWVYVDGVPRGTILFSEIPATLPIAWKDDVEGLDFHPGDPPPHEKKVQLLRWRLADYFQLIGIDVARIKMVYLHGAGYVAIPGPQFRKFADGITFDLTGNDLTKTRFYWPATMKTNTSFDRYAAVSVFIDKPPLKLDVHNNPFIDGVEVNGIPYHGTPERGGFRVYVDYKLAMVVKRNELGAVGRVADTRWDLMKLLASRGVKVQPVAGDLVIAQGLVDQRRDRIDEDYVKNLEIGVNSQASGTMLIGKDDRAATALHLYTRGHVPPVLAMPETRRDWQPPGKPAKPPAAK
jgi:hypothetical protein